MTKKFWLTIIGVLAAIAVLLTALPFLGFYSLSFLASGNEILEERSTKKEVRELLEEKYNLHFKVEVDVRTFVGTDISAYPLNKSSYTFEVNKYEDTYTDYFFDALYENKYKPEIKKRLSDYPELNGKVDVHAFFNHKALRNEKFDFKDGFPELTDLPVSPSFKLSGRLTEDEVDREKILLKMQSMIQFLNDEDIPHKDLRANFTLETEKMYFYYTYTIPKDAFEGLTSIEALKTHEKLIKAAKP
ncbi:hypothetical protein [Pseudalkalibacillus sp. SCS-8]|uniref:hypothetical protein n=1 Tax=Pseudalkalibacillus nanhaiensis TaxID=3115291 RepID=UPI0032DB182E